MIKKFLNFLGKLIKFKKIILITILILMFQNKSYPEEINYIEKKFDNYKIGLINNIPGAVYSVGVDNDDNVYATDFTNGYLFKFNIKEDQFNFNLIDLNLDKNQLEILKKNNSEILKAPGNFVRPHFVTFDKNGNIIIVESGISPKADPKNPIAGSIKVYELKTGNLVTEFKTLKEKAYELGYPNDTFGWNFPVTLTNDEYGNSYISEYRGHKITKFTRDKIIGWLGYKNNEKDQKKFYLNGKIEESSKFGGMSHPHTLRVGPDKNIYIADTGNKRILKYSFEGEYIGWIGKRENGEIKSFWSKEGNPVAGNELGAFDAPNDINFLDDNRMLITDKNNNRIVIVNLDGKSEYWLGKKKSLLFKDKGELWKKKGEPTPSDNFIGFDNPYGFILKNENLYVADRNNHRIKIIYNFRNLKFEN